LIQQNHDGLPQKAGFPQHCINEIHGAWFDPSNPVVTMSGDLRTDLVKRLDNSKKKSDLVLALGTSLAAVGADAIVDAAATRQYAGRGLGVCSSYIRQAG
jgi:NAD-dependent SIR2 family protein deacetylase